MGAVRDAMKKTRQPDREAAFQRKNFLRFLGRRANPSDALGRVCMGLYERLKFVHDDVTVGPNSKRIRFDKILAEYSQAYMKENFRGQTTPRLASTTEGQAEVEHTPPTTPTEDTRGMEVHVESARSVPDDERTARGDGLGRPDGDGVRELVGEIPASELT